MIATLLVLAAKPDFGALVLAEAKPLLGVPYVGNTLDQDPDRESIVTRDDGLDCVTFMELSLARARAKLSKRSVADEITKTRYFGGFEPSYVTRNHYTTGWLLNNAAEGHIEILLQTGAWTQRAPAELNFMSKNPHLYPQLKKHPEMVASIRDTEITFLDHDLRMVPKNQLNLALRSPKPGDILCFATSRAGLDYSHVGLIAGVKRGKVEFWHASSTLKKVVRDEDLAAYAERQTSCTGFVFARPLPPK